jgi:hypothetical protein
MVRLLGGAGTISRLSHTGEHAVTIDPEIPDGSRGERAAKTALTRLMSLLPAIIVSFAISLAFVVDGKVVFGGDYRSISLAVNHVQPFGPLDVVWTVLLAAAVTVVVANLPRFYRWLARLNLRAHVPAEGSFLRSHSSRSASATTPSSPPSCSCTPCTCSMSSPVTARCSEASGAWRRSSP